MALEEDEHDQRQNGDDDDIRKEEIPARTKLAYEGIESQLDGDVLCTGQEVQWADKVVVYADGRDNNDRYNSWSQEWQYD